MSSNVLEHRATSSFTPDTWCEFGVQWLVATTDVTNLFIIHDYFNPNPLS